MPATRLLTEGAAAAAAPGRPRTAADYRRLTPEFGVPGAVRYQLVEGELLPMSAPNRCHQEISGNLYGIIRGYLRQHPLGVLYASPSDVYLDEFNVLQPDLLFVSRARAAAVLVAEGVRGAPELMVEILSPPTAALDRRAKRRAYARAGSTAELWLIEPEARTVEVFALDQDAEQPAAVRGPRPPPAGLRPPGRRKERRRWPRRRRGRKCSWKRRACRAGGSRWRRCSPRGRAEVRSDPPRRGTRRRARRIEAGRPERGSFASAVSVGRAAVPVATRFGNRDGRPTEANHFRSPGREVL